MINEELIKRYEEAVQDVNEKISYLDSCIDDLKDSLRRFWDIENEFPAEALNELLKMGLLPGTVIEVNLNKNRF